MALELLMNSVIINGSMSKLNSINCPACGVPISTDVSAPKFCSECGALLNMPTSGASGSTAPDRSRLDQTQVLPSRSAKSNSAPDGPITRALDETSDSSFIIQRGAAGKALQPGDQIGPFRLGCILGAGGMGTVYEAYNTERDCSVALKLLSKQVRTNKESVERFRRESQIAASINHPGSTFVYRSGQFGEQIFIAMELMNGGTLKDIVEAEGPLESTRAVDFILDAINGLSAAHAVGIVHRDFKPSNCFIDDDGRAKVGDFGLAKNFIGDVNLTQTGTFIGTPQFAAPEQLRAANVDARTDIYAVGSTLFYLLSGRAPFIGDAAQVISGIAAEPAPSIKSIVPNVPDKLAQLVSQTLEKDPARRPDSLQHMRAALLPFSSQGAVPADTGRRIAALFIDTFILGFLSFAATLIATPLAFLAAAADVSLDSNVVNLFIALPITISYFAIQEYIWGSTIGKWLMGMRVINQNNDSPRLWQAVLRPVFVPGFRIFAILIGAHFLSPAGQQTLNTDGMTQVASMSLLSALSWIPCLLLLVTARQSNGYRGVHDLLSKTRVVRLSGNLESAKLNDVAVTLPLKLTDLKAETVRLLEPFEILGVLNPRTADGNLAAENMTAKPSTRVFVGRDLSLDRNVWIYQTAEEKPPFSNSAIRPTRQRIIASRSAPSATGGSHFFVAESIEGMPLNEFIVSANPIQWTNFRQILRDVADELQEATRENSLPENFGAANIWIDRSGQIKIVEAKLQTQQPVADSESISDSASAAPPAVFLNLLDQVIEHHPVPAHVVNFHANARADRIQMSKIVSTLDSMANIPSSWNWIDRLGLTCVSLAVELTILLAIGTAWVLIANSLLDLSSATIFYSLLGVGLTLSFWIGLFFESPSFWFLGISVGRRKRRAAPSKVRLGFRTFLAGLLPIVMVACFATMINSLVEAEKASIPPGGLTFAMVFGFMISSLLMLIVSMINLLNPSRGVADLICGTVLMRK